MSTDTAEEKKFSSDKNIRDYYIPLYEKMDDSNSPIFSLSEDSKDKENGTEKNYTESNTGK